MNFNIWEGIYGNFQECPSEGKGFEGETWVSRSVARIDRLLKIMKDNESISAGNDSMLPFLAAICLNKNDKINILDFGGGLGFTYINVLSNCLENKRINYFIVESKRICEVGRRIFEGNDLIHFYPSLPEKTYSIDMVYLGSSIHYVEDWKALIKDLLAYKPSYVLYEDLPAGNIPTFVTIQNYYESKIPCYFFNINDIIDVMSSMRYKLSFSSIHNGIYLGKPSKVPLSNFPEEYRIDNTRNLLFYKE